MLLRFGLLIQLAGRPDNNAKVVSSILTQDILFFQRLQIFNDNLDNQNYFYMIFSVIFGITLFFFSNTRIDRVWIRILFLTDISNLVSALFCAGTSCNNFRRSWSK